MDTEILFLEGRVAVSQADITTLRVDAIVNAANRSLQGGGGVDGAIHRRGGPAILAACRQLRQTDYPQGLPAGDAVITTAGDLPARYVIHTVGPIWGQDEEAETLLARCYRRSLEIAADYSLAQIAFPAISTGAYRFPKTLAAEVASRTIARAFADGIAAVRVHLVFATPDDVTVFTKSQQF